MKIAEKRFTALKYIAHIRNDSDISANDSALKVDSLPDSELQSVKEHLEGTADIASDFSVPVLKNIMYNSGLMHDIGKYQKTLESETCRSSSSNPPDQAIYRPSGTHTEGV